MIEFNKINFKNRLVGFGLAFPFAVLLAYLVKKSLIILEIIEEIITDCILKIEILDFLMLVYVVLFAFFFFKVFFETCKTDLFWEGILVQSCILIIFVLSFISLQVVNVFLMFVIWNELNLLFPEIVPIISVGISFLIFYFTYKYSISYISQKANLKGGKIEENK